MWTKADFQEIAALLIEKYPNLAPRFHAKDSSVLWNVDSMAARFAALSAQIEIAMAEPFDKVRDATILADAAMRGIMRKAVPARVRILVQNKKNSPYQVEPGRILLDSKGNYYTAISSVIIAANSEDTFEALQYYQDSFQHTITESYPFYEIEIPESSDDSYLAGIVVSDDFGELKYSAYYTNIFPGDRIYHVEMDERQKVYVRLGWQDMVGIQPNQGDIYTIKLFKSNGLITPALDSPFTFDSLLPADSNILLSLNAILIEGQNPPDMPVFRLLSRYPAIYDKNAVFEGNFDYLVRSHFPDNQFLSVWSERIEELARGADIDNINSLFIAVTSKTGNETTLIESDANHPVSPQRITNLTATQMAIKQVILKADDTYRIKFVTTVISKIFATITAQISTSYVANDIKGKIKSLLLDKYGLTSDNAKRGDNQPLYREVYDFLIAKIPALSDGKADLQVVITAQNNNAIRPELWRYMDESSITIVVTQINITQTAYGSRF